MSKTKLSEKLENIIKPLIDDHYKEKTFKEYIEDFIIKNFTATLGAKDVIFTPKDKDLIRWEKSVIGVAKFLKKEGFYVQIINGETLEISSKTLKEKMNKHLIEVIKKN